MKQQPYCGAIPACLPRQPAVAYLFLVRPMDPSPAPLRADALPYIERLIDAWCERRAIGPLRWILSGAYPGLYHTDQWLTVSTRLRPLRDFAMSSSRQKRKDWLRAALGILQEIFEPLEVVN